VAERLRLHGKRRAESGVIGRERVRFVVESVELRVVEPRVLDQLELAADIAGQTDEIEPAVRIVVGRI